MASGTLPQVDRLAVFRALQLGDMLVAMPALRALRTRYPAARMTLIGLPWAADLVARVPWIDEFMAFPGYPGLPEQEADPAALERFFTEARARGFDLAVQLHGRGDITNGVVAQLGARQVAGFHPPDRPPPDPRWFVPWPDTGLESERLMRLPLHLGAAHTGLRLEFPLVPSDGQELDAFWDSVGERPQRYVCIHPGARWRSRRWPAQRFAAVADALRERGYVPVLTGSRGDAEALEAFRAQTSTPILDAAERTSLGGLAALLSGARLLVCNDTGVSHLAAALRTPSVVICSGAEPARWAPIDRRRHRVLYHEVACRPCTHERCPYGHECAMGVEAESVLAESLRLLEREVPRAA